MYVYYLFQIAFVCMYKPTLAWFEHQNGSRPCRLCKVVCTAQCLYSAVSLSLVREQRFIKIIIITIIIIIYCK